MILCFRKVNNSKKLKFKLLDDVFIDNQKSEMSSYEANEIRRSHDPISAEKVSHP